MRRFRILAIAAVLIVVLMVVGTATSIYAYLDRPLPDYGAAQTIPGLTTEVTVNRDDRAIPVIEADNARDLFTAQGFVHAQDRFLEMDLRRRTASGRLSELLGPGQQQVDVFARSMGWRRVAEAELTTLKPDTRAALDAYSAGVNHYLKGRSVSEIDVSYTLLATGHDVPEPEPWTAVDSLAWLKTLSWLQQGSIDGEMGRALAFTSVRDLTRVNEIFPAAAAAGMPPMVAAPAAQESNAGLPAEVHSPAPVGTANRPAAGPSAASTLSSDGQVRSMIADRPAPMMTLRRAMQGMVTFLGGGRWLSSTAWAVAGDRTEHGHPLLVADAQFTAAAPGPLMQNSLRCRAVSAKCPYDVSGFSFTGVPGVYYGHSKGLGWSVASVQADVADIFVEQVQGSQVLLDGFYQPLTERREEIKIAGQGPLNIKVRSSSHGPLVTDALDQIPGYRESTPIPASSSPARPAPTAKTTTGPGAGVVGQESAGGGSGIPAKDYHLAIAWTGQKPGSTMDALLAYNAAADAAALTQASANFAGSPSALVYADTDGGIGLQVQGSYPLRPAGNEPGKADGSWPRPGWDSSWSWQGTIAPQQLPKISNPAEGLIVAADQPVTAPGAAPLSFTDADPGYRAHRIRQRFEEWHNQHHLVTGQDMVTLQSDAYTPIAPQLVPLLLATPLGEGRTESERNMQAFTAPAVDLLRNWDYQQDQRSPAAAYYNAVWSNLLRLTFADEPRNAVSPDGSSRWTQVLISILNDPANRWWDDQSTSMVVEHRDQVLAEAMTAARIELTTTLGKEPKEWRWGKMHLMDLKASNLPLQGVGGWGMNLLAPAVQRVSGGPGLVNQTSYDASSKSGYKVDIVSAMRMVMDTGAWDRSTWIALTGVSGHPTSDHYVDQMELWRTGHQLPWVYSKEEIAGSQDSAQVLKPGSDN